MPKNFTNLFKAKELFSSQERKSFLYLLITLIFAAGFIGFNYYLLFRFQIPRPTEEKPGLSGKEAILERQLREIDELRKKAEGSLSEEEKKEQAENQMKELDTLHKEVIPSSPEESEKQLEELEKLR